VTDVDTLVRISRLYYELGETQERIAELVGVTRPQVSRMLKRAREEGVVEIRILDGVAAASTVAEALQRRFGLREVHLAPTLSGPEDLTRRSVGRLAAQVLRSNVRDGAIVGVGDGASMSALADGLVPPSTPIACVVVPLNGGYWYAGPHAEPFRRVGELFGATAMGLPAPGIVNEPQTKTSLYAHGAVRSIVALWTRLDVAIFGIGSRAWNDETFGPRMYEALNQAGAVGEVLVAPYDIDGRFVAPELRDRVIGYDARELPRVPVTIGVAGGQSKVRPVLGALRTGVVKVLVTDVRTAELVVELDDAQPRIRAQ
jgi:DNA-binding transcriptional regulator LsrR (DeoR family)